MGSTRFDFTDETVIVTGGSSGIGRAIAVRFGEAGANVIVADVREEPKDVDAERPTHEVVNGLGGEGAYVETDVSEYEEVAAAVEVAREFGGVDVMVNNAGIFLESGFTDLTPEEFRRMHDVNVGGIFFGTQAAATDMMERDEPGPIVNTASISSTFAQRGQVHYDSTKGAVRMITRGAALELADAGIRVNAVAPGQIATEFVEGLTEEMHEDVESGGFIKPIPMGREGHPADVAPAALYLASEDARYTTGELVHVDGGWHTF
jgi:NAD(P)-dependent dehydrogenase (short-subunit alcohol dehydrogenase family)